MASSHPHYLTYTLQTYHHPEYRFRACLTQMTSQSHLHTQARMQQKNTTIHIHSFCLDKTSQSYTKSRQNNLHSVHSRPCGIYEQCESQNTQHCTKVPGLILHSKLTYSTHIHKISVHNYKLLQLITTFIAIGLGNQKEILVGSHETGSGVCLFHMVASCILDQH